MALERRKEVPPGCEVSGLGSRVSFFYEPNYRLYNSDQTIIFKKPLRHSTPPSAEGGCQISGGSFSRKTDALRCVKEN